MRWWLLGLGLTTGCGTLNTARPAEPGEHVVGLSLGGALLDLGAPFPMPHAVLGVQSGVAQLGPAHPLAVDYGLNLTAAAFGVVGLHGGLSTLLFDEQRARPALSLANRIHLYDNHLDARKPAGERGSLVVDQLELTASYAPGGQLIYAGLAEYLDFGNPDLLLTPFVGTELDPGARGGPALQLELRYFAANRQQVSGTVPFVAPGSGALGLVLGLHWRLGAAP